MTEGTLNQEIQSRKALGILLIAEKDYNLRNTVIKLLVKYYPIIIKAVKKYNKRELAKRYLEMDKSTRKTQVRLDAAIYL